ncbi:MAG: restriction endonuclease subunit S [Chloroflexota bacterium]|nr:restriction endonuclease subunit S [Chloroflexota bacterium]
MNQQNLPEGWAVSIMADACQIVQGQSPPGETYNSCGIGLPFLQGKAEFGEIYPTAIKWCSAPNKIAETDDVLISIRAPVGPTNLCPARSCIGRGLAAIRPEGGIPSRFILYSLRATEQELRSNSTGTTFDAIRGEALRSYGIALPPLSEQHRIVAEIETQFTRLDASVAALRRAQANLKRYRASVLKDACEGRLVPSEAELARSEGREYEPAAVLLERILADRRKRWESQEKRRGKYREPSDPDASTLPQLPEGWAWATVEQLSLRIQYGTSRKASSDAEGVPVLRMGNIQEGALDFSDLKYLPSQDEEVEKTLLNPGDLVFNRTNSPELVGKSAVYKESHPSACFASYLIRVAFPEACLPDYVCFFINSQHGRAYIAQVRSQQVGQANVNGTKLAAIPIPLPPLAEQWRIVAEVERQLSVMQQAEATVDASLARAERLRQSILKQAFSGKLVPQDPGDEPASALLERIRAEREAEAQASLAVKGKAGQRGKRKAAA